MPCSLFYIFIKLFYKMFVSSTYTNTPGFELSTCHLNIT
uniref:Uncharacterized protein n=1 Tax=Podoviridae sp. ct8nN1 TaxID=2827296 RepID=A0A8S5R3K0_9CAUD|nr:MAG TPA: hypothetical protein [Podoviridae sp. ct8nN1]